MRPATEPSELAGEEVADTGGAAGSGDGQAAGVTDHDVDPAPAEDGDDGDEELHPEARPRRDRRTHREVEIQAAPDGDSRWPHLDVNQALRMLQHPTDKGVILRTLRRLHVKWFHASADQMHRVLKAAGIPRQVLRDIPQITDSCRICRSWARPTEHSKTSIRLSTRFNESVQLDVLYWTDYMILHLMDECTKWCVAEMIGSTDDQELITSITLKWFQPFGAPSNMIVDGEKGLASDTALHWLSSWGVERIPRAPNQHAHLIERHHQILRDLLHKVQSQHDEEGLVSAPQLLLAECVLAKNTMLSIAGESPYHALYGRTPKLLPEVLDRQGLSVLEDKPDDPLLVRNHHRIRELALENIVRENARRRLEAAAKSRATPAAEELQLEIGDMVEFYSKPTHKDASGWRGPAKVVDLSNATHGNIGLNFQGRPMIRSIRDLRKALVYVVFLVPDQQQLANHGISQPLTVVRQYLHSLPLGHLEWFGPVRTGERYHLSQHATQHPEVYFALLVLASATLNRNNCLCCRLGHGLCSMPANGECTDSLTFWWKRTEPQAVWHLSQESRCQVNFRGLCHEAHEEHVMLQFVSMPRELERELSETLAVMKDLHDVQVETPSLAWSEDTASPPMTAATLRSNEGVLFQHVEELINQTSCPLATTRTNVFHSTDSRIRCLVLGYYTGRGEGVTNRSYQEAELLCAIHKLAKLRPEPRKHVPYTSVCLTTSLEGQGVPVHTDGKNGAVSDITAVGSYKHGRLWVSDRPGTSSPPQKVSQGFSTDLKGRYLDLHRQWQVLDGTQPHAAEDFTGWRVSITLYTPQNAYRMSDGDLHELQTLGFPCSRTKLVKLCCPDATMCVTVEHESPESDGSGSNSDSTTDEITYEDNRLPYHLCCEQVELESDLLVSPSVLPDYHLICASVYATPARCGMRGNVWPDRTSSYAEYEPLELGLTRELFQCSSAQGWPHYVENELVFVQMEADQNVIARSEGKSNHNLSSEEKRQHAEEVKAAILSELKRWTGLNSLKRVPRRGAVNILESIYVLTWKRDSKGNRQIKCRLCVRGFQDIHAQDLETYSGTSSRWGQRLICAIAAQHKWLMRSYDVSAAFLRGLSFDEVSELDGTPVRQVHMDLPPGGHLILKAIEGFHDFDPVSETLAMLKGGFGLKDAPRLWTRKCTKDFATANILPLHSDEKVYVRHIKGQLNLILSAHMDDFKVACSEATHKEFLLFMKKHYGEDVKHQEGEYEHTGITHIQNLKDFTVELHQRKYAAALQATDLPELRHCSDDKVLQGSHYSKFRTLLGGLSWLMLTRADLAVYTTSLQRVANKPTVGDWKRLIRVVRYAQTHPRS
eukprot:6465576-Amphidinium_carterae.1